MDQTTPVNVSFIPKALTVIHGLLHEADVAQAMGDKAKEHDKLSEAGAQARVALQELHGLPLWDQLRAERQLRLQQWEDLGLPVIARLLEELGYKPPPPAQDLIDIGNEAVRAAAGLPDQEKPDPITQAQDAISDLDKELERLMKSKRNRRKLRSAIRGACGVLAKGFGAAIVIPAVQAGMHQLSPDAAELLRDLLGHAAHVLPSLSMALVVGLVHEVHGLVRTQASVPVAAPRPNQTDDRPTRTLGGEPMQVPEVVRAFEGMLAGAEPLALPKPRAHVERSVELVRPAAADLIRALEEALEAAKRLTQQPPTRPTEPGQSPRSET